MKCEVIIDGASRKVEVTVERRDKISRVTATIDGRSVEADAAEIQPGVYSILIGGRSIDVHVGTTPNGMRIHASNREHRVEITDPRSWRRVRGGRVELEGHQQVMAPMPGKVVQLLVAAGQQVEAGQGLVVLEAMKMQNEIPAPKSGTIERLLIKEGQAVNAGEVLLVVA